MPGLRATLLHCLNVLRLGSLEQNIVSLFGELTMRFYEVVSSMFFGYYVNSHLFCCGGGLAE